MSKVTFPKLAASAVILSMFMAVPAMAQTTTAPPTQSDNSGGNIISPPSSNTPGTPTNSGTSNNADTAVTPGANSGNGVSPNSSSEQDKPSGPVADKDVFSFDITGGAASLTAEQLTAARNTCNEQVTIEPQRYSSAVKDFCMQVTK